MILELDIKEKVICNLVKKKHEKARWRTNTMVLSTKEIKLQRPTFNCTTLLARKMPNALGKLLFFAQFRYKLVLLHQWFDNRFWVLPGGTGGFVINAVTACDSCSL